MSEEDEDQAAGAPPKRPRAASPPPPPPPDQVLDNVLETVLQFLRAPGDRGAASLVCRSWHRAESATRASVAVRNILAASPARAARRFPNAHHILLKGRPRFADFNLLPPGWAASAFRPWAAALAAAAFPALRSLSLKRITVTDDDLDLLARSLPPSFRELSLLLCDGFSSRGLASLASHCRGLRVLDVVDCELNEEEDDEVSDWVAAFPRGHTDLESLSFECFTPQVPFAALEALVARSPRLRRLRVNQHVSLGQLRRLMALTPRLTHLGTGSFRPGDGAEDEGLDFGQMLTAFASAGRANSLVSLSGFRDLAPEYLPTIATVAANLTSMDLSYAPVNPDQVLLFIGQCRSLETLWVLDSVRDEGLQAVAMYCKKLQVLRVLPLDAHEDADELVSEVGLTAISEGCRDLRSILYFCQRMTNAAVITMSQNCPEMKVFRLCIMGRHRPDHVTGEPMDEGFGAIVRNCSKLTRLSTSGHLTDRAFEYIGNYGSSLRTLSVAFAGDSDLALQHILQGCSKLEKLEIRDCPFGDAGLLSGMHHFYNMRFVWMSGCSLTLQGCEEVARQLPRMVVELINSQPEIEKTDGVDILYMYRSLEGPREDVPPFVKIL
ncbi:transport inhibitor response 1-like protein [Triticum urartu]|uniref:Transport inhibitor response 1-like protein n=1 Tax=Triticum urartu TaxID=4572 RepID=A0A8R7Q9P4_TRIUA|nr:transport inhibitor response 1-like protein [Triticum urartu]XP_048572525.1 transport inhibitor response 1-like protein [Triticum urartu]